MLIRYKLTALKAKIEASKDQVGLDEINEIIALESNARTLLPQEVMLVDVAKSVVPHLAYNCGSESATEIAFECGLAFVKYLDKKNLLL